MSDQDGVLVGHMSFQEKNIIIFSPGARFSEVPIINGPIKPFWFTCKIEGPVSVVLHPT